MGHCGRAPSQDTSFSTTMCVEDGEYDVVMLSIVNSQRYLGG